MIRSSVEFENQAAGSPGSLILKLPSVPERNDESNVVARRLSQAAEWALDLDAQYRSLVQAGRSPEVTVPTTRRAARGRVSRETLADYRELRRGIGELIRPVLLEQPSMEELFPFQRRGVEWLVGRKSALLADDMGLGKSVQVIVAMRLLFNRAKLRTTLVVCPKSLIATWEREFDRWAPELGVSVLTPPAQVREEAWKALIGRCHVLLTNYEQLRTPPQVLRREALDLVVADEAHRLRNRSARITSGSFQLSPKRFWALTGTPLERDLEDLTTLLSLIAPKDFSPNDAKLHPSSIRSRARSYVLRRRKKEVLEELPPVLDTTEMLELSEAQVRAYRSAVEVHRQTGERGNELALLTQLQAICDLDPRSRQSCKVERTLDLLDRIRAHREKMVVFSYRLEPLRELHRRIAKRWGLEAVGLLVGEMNDGERERTIAHFRNDDRAIALLTSSRVGSEGLTLVEANHVLLFNQWWNPSANDQARDRVVRIGQQRKVRVYRFCCRGTMEENMERIFTSKRMLFESAVERIAQGEGDGWTRVLREVGLDRLISEIND